MEQLLVASCCYRLVNTAPPSPTTITPLPPPLPSSTQQRLWASFKERLWICFPQIICRGPSGLYWDSRQSRCARLTKESDVYKCKHSILFTHFWLAASRCILSRAQWLGAFLFSLVKPSVKPNSVEGERHFMFDAWTCASQTNLVPLHTTKGRGVFWITDWIFSKVGE